MRLWQFRFSTNVERVALALAHKGLDAEPVVIDPDDRSGVRALSGQDLVPVLELGDGEVLSGSLDIVAHLEDRFPDAPLYPADPARRAEVELLLAWFDGVWKGPPNELADALLAGRHPDEPELRTLGEVLRASLDRFEALLQGRDFLAGRSFSVVDLAVFPFLKYGVGAPDEDDEVFHRILVEHLRPETRHHRLRDWIRRVDDRPRAGLAT
jgi:glutathione S-transferase